MCLFPLFFSLYLNGIEEQYMNTDLEGIDINMFKAFLLLYADDIVIFSNTAVELLLEYCNEWKLTITLQKRK